MKCILFVIIIGIIFYVIFVTTASGIVSLPHRLFGYSLVFTTNRFFRLPEYGPCYTIQKLAFTEYQRSPILIGLQKSISGLRLDAK